MPSKYKLPADKVATLKAAQRELHDVLPLIDEAEQCGIECQQYRQLAEEVQERITKILTYFGPGVKQA